MVNCNFYLSCIIIKISNVTYWWCQPHLNYGLNDNNLLKDDDDKEMLWRRVWIMNSKIDFMRYCQVNKLALLSSLCVVHVHEALSAANFLNFPNYPQLERWSSALHPNSFNLHHHNHVINQALSFCCIPDVPSFHVAPCGWKFSSKTWIM